MTRESREGRSGAKKGIFRLLLFVAVAATLTLSHAADAQDLKSQLQECGSVTDNMARLQCYDNIVKQPGMSNPTSGSTGNGSSNGSWSVDQQNNPMDDTSTVVLSNSSTSGVDQQGNPIILFIRCQSGQMDVYLAWGDFLGDTSTDTELRVGSAPSYDESWSNSTDNTAAFSPNPLSLVRSLEKADRLVVEVTPYNESPIIATFDISGLTSAVAPLAQDCKLKL